MHAHTSAYKQTRVPACTNTRAYAHAQQTYACTYRFTHARARAHIHTHARTQRHTRTQKIHLSVKTHTHTRKPARMQIHVPAQCTYTYTDFVTHALAHIHARVSGAHSTCPTRRVLVNPLHAHSSVSGFQPTDRQTDGRTTWRQLSQMEAATRGRLGHEFVL